MKVRDVIRLLENDGWRHLRTRGSHRQFQHPAKPGTASHGAYVPDLPGCVAVAETRREVLRLIREGIALHIEARREAGEPVPPPVSKSQVVKVRAA